MKIFLYHKRRAPCRPTISGVVGALALFTACGFATTPSLIPVQNPSFEDPVLASGTYTNATPAGWQETTPNGPNSFTEHIPGFSIAGNDPLAGKNHEGIANGDAIWQDLSATLSPDTQYSLIVGIGHRDAVSTQPGNQSVFRLQLKNGSTILNLASQTVDATTIPPGTFRSFNVTYVTGANPQAGTLRIRLQVNSADRAHFDGVKLVGIPTLESRPGATGLLYLDFDGETVTDSKWNNSQTFTVSPSGLPVEQIRKAFEVVKEDYLPFNINVTTRRDLYDARNSGPLPYRRMRCLITPSFQWYVDSGGGDPFRGRAHGGSFRLAGSAGYSATVPAFIFIRDIDASGNILEDGLELGGEASHELGHTLGLEHDATSGGGEYFFGNGGQQGPLSLARGTTQHLNFWGSIMGAVDYGFLTQWCKGDYYNYSSPQANPDDVAIIASMGTSGNDFGYATDDTGDTIAGAKNIPLNGSAFSANGFIGRTATGGIDRDVFKFVLPAAAELTLLVRPAEPVRLADPLQEQFLNLGVANLYMAAELLASGGSLVTNLAAGADSPLNAADLQPTEFLRKRTVRSLGAGTYYLNIVPSAYGNPYLAPYTLPNGGKATYPGFTDYGSMGAYSLSGSVVWTVPQITSPLLASGVVTQAFPPYQAAATAGPVTWSASGLPDGLSVNNSTGVISGTPGVTGTFNVVLRAATAATFGEATLVITITTPAAPVILGPFTDTAEEGQPYSNQITASGGPTSYGLSGGAIPGLSVNAATGAITGTPAIPGEQGMTLTASNTWGSGFRSFILMVRSSPATALDTATMAFSRPDAKKWFGQSAVTSDFIDAMQSPALNHGESSSIETTVTGPGTISYDWRADTEPGDVLTFRAGGAVLDSVSGNSGWQSRSQSIPAGVQTLRWTFARNASGSGGSDAVWLDRISWSAATGPTITSPLAVNWTCGQTAVVDLTSDDPATVWTMGGALPEGIFFLGSSKVIGAIPRRPGTFSFTLFATNNLGTTTRAFRMNIESSYTAWARANGLGAGSELGDPDKDGITNIAELAFALDPLVKDSSFHPVSFDPATRRMRASFKRRHQFYPDLMYEVQVSSSLQAWTAIARVDNGATLQNPGGAFSIAETQASASPPIYDVVVLDGTIPSAAVPRRQMRVKITQQ